MARTCEICGRMTASQSDRFCRPHAYKHLLKLEKAGYLEPLTVMTQDGLVKLSNQRFLTVGDGLPRAISTLDSLKF